MSYTWCMIYGHRVQVSLSETIFLLKRVLVFYFNGDLLNVARKSEPRINLEWKKQTAICMLGKFIIAGDSVFVGLLQYSY